MRTLQLATSSGKGKVVDIEYSSMSNTIMVICHDFAFPITDIDRSTSYFLDPKHYKKLASYKSVSALVKYAKANQITDSASDAHSGSDSASVTSCPAPAPAPAKSAAKGQGILFVLKTKKLNQNATGLLSGCLDSVKLYNLPPSPLRRVLHPYLPYQCGSYRPIRLLPIS